MLVKVGEFVARSLRAQGIRRADVGTALRARGADGPADVAKAILSVGGTASSSGFTPEQQSANRAMSARS